MQNNNLLPLINENKTAFIPYLVAGHTNNEVFTAALQLLDDLGADLIEIGIPFTDPIAEGKIIESAHHHACLLYTSPSPRDRTRSRMPSSA